MKRLSFDEQLEDLRDISGTVDDYIVRELYKEDYGHETEDTYNPNAILYACYDIILDELEAYGVYIQDREEVLRDWYTAKHAYYIRAFLDADNLLTLLATRGELSTLSSILDAEVEDMYSAVIDFFYLVKTSETYGILTYLAHNLRTDDLFIQHLRACIDRIRETGSEYYIPEAEMNRVQTYLQYVVGWRNQIQNLVANLCEVNRDIAAVLTSREATHHFSTFGLITTRPDRIRDYAAYEIDTGLTRADLQQKMEGQYFLEDPFRIEYYVNRGTPPTTTEAIGVMLATLVTQYLVSGATATTVLENEYSDRIRQDFSTFTFSDFSLDELLSAIISVCPGEANAN